ncbi:hypothetical protein QFC22_005314 [Naganishia vaughanmartiniae]|uniref:Uncharacterized protein n=1 Tax=Naganishia vaughanmartiniae TaxID=1424756 RepID=A0ACC2WVX6_9TREE|nr:hypothetical protein QFC22_005314 [Naganishia vaughanmartiniae]
METPLQSPQQRPRTTPRTRRNLRPPAALSSPSRGLIRSHDNPANRSSNAAGLSIESNSGSRDAYLDDSADVSFKQWTTNHIEWSYEGISSLSANSSNTPISERSALLGKVIAHTKFRIDVVFNSQQSTQAEWQTDLEDRLKIHADADDAPASEAKEAEPHFRVYIATVIDDQEDYRNSREILSKDASIFLGIKPRDEAVVKRHAYTEWIWQTSTTHVFTDDFSFCENPRIREQDAFTLVLRLQAPAAEDANFNQTGKQMVDRERDSTGKRHPTAATDRTIQTIRCLDVDYITMYWLLHYIYSGEVDFKDEQNFADSMDLQTYKIDAGFARRLESDRADSNEWEWSDCDPFQEGSHESNDEDDDNATVKSASTRRSSASTSPHQYAKSSVTASAPSNSTKPIQSPPDKRTVFPTTTASGSRSSRPTVATGSATAQHHASGRKLSSPTAPMQQAYMRPVPLPDPHDHPAGPVPPASAFATYALAHRYQLDDLARLAEHHLLASLTPHGACSLLMASFRFDKLHALVEDYVITNWEAIRGSPAFLETIQEVASGS